MVYDRPLLEFYQARLAQSTSHTDFYKGREMAKMPEDLRVYQHLIEISRPEVIVELGTYHGGSAIWFADQLDVLCGGGRVVTVDVNLVPFGDDRIIPLTGALDDRDVVAAVHAVATGKRVLVSEDSAHTYRTTMAALEHYAELVMTGGWFVVEDAVVDNPDLNVWHGEGGVVPAIEEFLRVESGSRFVRHDLDLYGVTSNPGGWLEAVR